MSLRPLAILCLLIAACDTDTAQPDTAGGSPDTVETGSVPDADDVPAPDADAADADATVADADADAVDAAEAGGPVDTDATDGTDGADTVDGGDVVLLTDANDADAGVCEDCTIATQLSLLGPQDAVNCGQLSSHPGFPADDPETVRTCVSDALAGGTDFTVTHMLFGTDSTIEHAWYSTGGAVVRLSYDSHPCGGDAGCLTTCGPRAYSMACGSPTLAALEDSDFKLIDCAGTATPQLICGFE